MPISMPLLSYCARLLAAFAQGVHPNCTLEVQPPEQMLGFASKRSVEARHAVQDFQRLAGSPYSVLYLKEGPAGATYVRWVQRSSTRFTRYTYRAQQVDSTQVVAVRLPRCLARLPRACYSPECESISTAPIHRVLLVKQGQYLKTGLSFTDYVAQDFTRADQARIAPLIAVMHELEKDW
ncbi:hypothetical protein [Hymenobacter seoulensis]